MEWEIDSRTIITTIGAIVIFGGLIICMFGMTQVRYRTVSAAFGTVFAFLLLAGLVFFNFQKKRPLSYEPDTTVQEQITNVQPVAPEEVRRDAKVAKEKEQRTREEEDAERRKQEAEERERLLRDLTGEKDDD